MFERVSLIRMFSGGAQLSPTRLLSQLTKCSVWNNLSQQCCNNTIQISFFLIFHSSRQPKCYCRLFSQLCEGRSLNTQLQCSSGLLTLTCPCSTCDIHQHASLLTTRLHIRATLHSLVIHMRQATTHDQEDVSSISPLASDLILHAKQSRARFEPLRAWFLSPHCQQQTVISVHCAFQLDFIYKSWLRL